MHNDALESLHQFLDDLRTISAGLPTVAVGKYGKAGPAMVVRMIDALEALVEARRWPQAVIEGITLGGTMRELTHLPLVEQEARRWQGNKKNGDAKRTIATKKKARALQMYHEWYLDLPKRDRPDRADVIADIARRLDKEFPVSPTTPRTVRSYLPSKKSEKL